MNISDLPIYIRVAIGAVSCGFFALVLSGLCIVASMIPEGKENDGKKIDG